MNKIFSKKNKGQQLVEFAIVVPILILVILVIVEFGNAVNTRTTLAEGSKRALMEVNKLSNLTGTKTNKEKLAAIFIKNELIEYLDQHNIPNTGSLQVVITSTDDTAVANISYIYNLMFVLPGFFGGATPTSIPFQTTQTLNPAIFKENNFNSGLTTADLSNFNNFDRGALVDSTYNFGLMSFDVRRRIAILLEFYKTIGSPTALDYDYARLVSWDGEDLLPPGLRINLKTATLEVKSPYYRNGNWFDTKIPYVWVTNALGYTHLFYIRYNSYSLNFNDAASQYRLDFSVGSENYNRGVQFCGINTESSIDCNTDMRGTGLVNERILRLNPRLGAPPAPPPYSWNNNIIYGAHEPILIPSDPTHYFNHIKGFYYSYTGNYTNFNGYYFSSISQPKPASLTSESVYSAEMALNSANPFYHAYRQERFGLKTNPAPKRGEITSGTDFVIVDVYIDSDGDGIPDAWDNEPSFFDYDCNGELDGNQTSVGSACGESVNASLSNTQIAKYGDPATPYILATPFKLSNKAFKNTFTSLNLPSFDKGVRFYARERDPKNKLVDNNEALYVYTGVGQNYTRQLKHWGTNLTQKSRFVHGSVSGAEIKLDVSDEIDFLYKSSFSPNNKLYRVPPTVW